MSDARLKTNINQVGNLPNGLGLYTWDWTEDAVEKRSEQQYDPWCYCAGS
jgi:hypothetical protein